MCVFNQSFSQFSCCWRFFSHNCWLLIVDILKWNINPQMSKCNWFTRYSIITMFLLWFSSFSLHTEALWQCLLNYLGSPAGQNCNLFGSQINQSTARCSHTYSLVYKTAKKYFHTAIRNYKTHYDDTKTWWQTKRHIRQQDQ